TSHDGVRRGGSRLGPRVHLMVATRRRGGFRAATSPDAKGFYKTMKDIKPWMAVGALVAAGGLLVACGSSGGMTDATSDPEEMAELVEQGLAGEETVTCVVSGTDEGTVYLASEEQFRFDGEVDGESPSMVSTGDEVFIWVDGEDTGASLS